MTNSGVGWGLNQTITVDPVRVVKTTLAHYLDLGFPPVELTARSPHLSCLRVDRAVLEPRESRVAACMTSPGPSPYRSSGFLRMLAAGVG
jgi:hypothetical protein